jgi:CheY-like chemotaxis protein
MKTVLVVDDDLPFRRMICAILAQAGYAVIEAADGGEALRMHGGRLADVLLTDLLMPEREGLETIQEFRRSFPGMPIIAMSGGGRFDAKDMLQVAHLFGAEQTLRKPFSRDELMAALGRVGVGVGLASR